MHRKNRKGFTLSELLVVVAIIGILVAVSLPTFISTLKETRYETNIKNIRAGYTACLKEYLDYLDTVDTTDGSNASNTTVTYTYDTDTGEVTQNIGSNVTWTDTVHLSSSNNNNMNIATWTAAMLKTVSAGDDSEKTVYDQISAKEYKVWQIQLVKSTEQNISGYLTQICAVTQ